MDKNKIKGILGLIFGILGVIILPIIFALLAIFFGFKTIKGGFAKIGWAGILLGVIAPIISFSGVSPLVTEYQSGMSHVQTYNWKNCNDNCWYSLKNFDAWWNEERVWPEGEVRHVELRKARYQNGFGITKEQFESFPLPNGIENGDVLIRTKVNFNELKVGDVIVYRYHNGQLRPSRIIKIFSKDGTNYIEELSDANSVNRHVSEDQIVYKVSARIPKVGLLNFYVVELLDSFAPIPFD